MFSLAGTILSLSLLSFAAAHTIVFTASSDSLVPGITEQLSMRCELDLEEFDNDRIINIVSIIIEKSPDHQVASITRHRPATANPFMEDVHVKGDLSGTSGNRSYLSVHWNNPTVDDANSYKCLIVAINGTGYPVTWQSTLNVSRTDPDINHILKLALEQRDQINDLTQELQALDAESKHIETGTVDCGGESNWSEGRYGTKTRTAAFSRPYLNAPIAFVSVTGFKSRYSNMYVNFWAKSETVNTTHIELLCQTGEEDSIVRYLGVRWITFPQ